MPVRICILRKWLSFLTADIPEVTFSIILHAAELFQSLKKQKLSLSLHIIGALRNNYRQRRSCGSLLIMPAVCRLTTAWDRYLHFANTAVLTSPVQWASRRGLHVVRHQGGALWSQSFNVTTNSLYPNSRNPPNFPPAPQKRPNCRHDWAWGPPNLPYNGYLVSFRGVIIDHLPPYSTEV